ncbi:MAG TPA: phospholipid methyltransferase [Rhodanobacter sp.]|nr:phospholipid methyltransferase [Rhodanobacter sp.]
MALAENLSFLRAWLRAPQRVGALVPSGPALARLMTAQVNHLDGPVIELGPGTGVFTRALLGKGVPPQRLALVEADPILAAALAQHHPHLRVLNMDAAQLGATAPLFGDELASAVVSGLPLLSIPAPQVMATLRGAFEHQLRADGAFYQFTYAPHCPVPSATLQQLDLEAVRTGTAWFNLPPARVYRIRRRQHVAA